MATPLFGIVAGNYSDGTKWSTLSAPTSADNAQANALSANIVVDVSSAARSLDFTGYTGTFSGSAALAIGDATTATGSSYLKLVSGMTFTYSGTITFKSASATQHSITSAGKTFAAITLEGFATNTPNLVLSDALIVTGTIQQNGGIFNSGGFNVTCGKYLCAGGNGRTVTITNSTINLTGTGSGDILNFNNATVSATGSTINIVNTSTSARNFFGFGATYGTLNYTVAGSTGKLTIQSSNTFAVINFSDANNARTLELTASTTTTIPASGFRVNGTSGKLMSVISTTSGTPATIAITGGNIVTDYVSVKDITVSGGLWYAGSHSTDGGGNTNVIFTDPPLRNRGLLGVGV